MEAYHADSSASRADRPQRTRATTWVPRRVFYVLRYLQRTLSPGKSQALSNKQIQTAIHFGSEGEVSQIMRWLAGEAPTMGHWAYGALNNTPQQYCFIDRERMPSGGYLITLLATPKPIDAPVLALPQIVQLSFLDDPSVIPHAAQPKAPEGGSFFHDPSGAVDSQQQHAAKYRSRRDQHEENLKESNSSSVGASSKNDWSTTTIDGARFLPIAALEKAGVTPQIVQEADRKILTRCEYTRAEQVKILFQSLLTQQPIYSASEIAARSEEPSRERPDARAAHTNLADHGTDRPGRSDRRENRQRPRAAATRFSRESYRRQSDA